MIYSSLAVIALAASAAAPQLSSLVHLHPHARVADNRVSLSIYNKAPMFMDVKVDGHIYTVNAHQSLLIKAPAGTVVYAASRTPALHPGDVVLTVAPEMKDKQVGIN